MNKCLTFLIVVMVAIGAFVAGFFLAKEQLQDNTDDIDEYRSLVATVYMVDVKSDIVIFKDSTGNLWNWSGTEDWEVGDSAALMMNTQGTEKIFDDVIVRAYYSAFELS